MSFGKDKPDSTTPYSDPETYGVYADASIHVDQGKREATITVRLKHGVIKTYTYPIPVLAACACDNPDGKCLQQSGKLKL